jgi:ribosome-binding protein aMBF1 (putative translation factor)
MVKRAGAVAAQTGGRQACVLCGNRHQGTTTDTAMVQTATNSPEEMKVCGQCLSALGSQVYRLKYDFWLDSDARKGRK